MNIARALFYVVVFIVGFGAVSLVSFWLAVNPPQISINQTPADVGLLAEDLILYASDGIPLAGWFMKEKTPRISKRAIILLHGYPVEKSDMLNIASSLHEDFALLLMDLRSFGKSGGAYTTLGVKERDDITKVVDFLHTRGYTHIGIFGFSLGGVIAMLAAQHDPRINAVASYGAFADLRQLGYETYRTLLFLKYPLVRLMEMWARILFGAWLSDHAPTRAIQELSIPIFLIHSRDDEQIPFSHFEHLRKASGKNLKAEFFIVEEGLHGELPLDFNIRLKTFFGHSLLTGKK